MTAAASSRPVTAGVIGTGHFATAVVTQAESIPQLHVPAVADLNPDAARQAYRAAGLADDEMRLCESRADALAALERGKRVIVQDARLLMELPLDVIVEATGIPEAGARHAQAAIRSGKHVAMVTKETDCLIGPVLARQARQAGLVYTPVDGDQHGLLIRLVGWCRGLGLEVLCGGKSRDGEFLFQPKTGTVEDGRRQVQISPEEARWLEPLPPEELHQHLARRMELLADLPGPGGWDLTEMAIAANGTGLLPDVPLQPESGTGGHVHGPALYTPELPHVFCPGEDGGLLARRGAIEIVTALRTPEAAGLWGGVFVVVEAASAYSRHILATKTCFTNRAGNAALIYWPWHLCGVETPSSIIRAGQAGVSTVDDAYRPRVDVLMRATRDLSAGETLGNDHSPDLEALLGPAQPLADDAPLPLHLGNGNRLAVDVPAGTVITGGMVQPPADSALWRLRAEQEQAFGRGGEDRND